MVPHPPTWSGAAKAKASSSHAWLWRSMTYTWFISHPEDIQTRIIGHLETLLPDMVHFGCGWAVSFLQWWLICLSMPTPTPSLRNTCCFQRGNFCLSYAQVLEKPRNQHTRLALLIPEWKVKWFWTFPIWINIVSKIAIIWGYNRAISHFQIHKSTIKSISSCSPWSVFHPLFVLDQWKHPWRMLSESSVFQQIQEFHYIIWGVP